MKQLIFFGLIMTSLNSIGQFPTKLDTISITTIQPYNKICYLHIYREKTFKKNSWYQSTGFFITPNIILTAGHNIHTTEFSKVTHIVITPGKFYKNTPYDSIELTNYDDCLKAIKTHPNYTFTGKNRINWDFGIIILPQNVISKNLKIDSNQVFTLDSTFELKVNDTLNVAGYPADPKKYYHGDFMTFQQDICRGVYNKTFSHMLDTYTGNSGSPIWLNSKGKIIIVGVHTFGNLGTKMNKENIRLIWEWINNNR